MKSLFEQTSGTYRKEKDYLIPNIILPNEKIQPIGIWRQRHLMYLKEHRIVNHNIMYNEPKHGGMV